MTRKILIALTVLLFTFPSFSQTIKDRKLSDLGKYIQIEYSISETSIFSSLSLLFNNEFIDLRARKSLAINSKNEVVQIISVIQALNFFTDNGFEFVQLSSTANHNDKVYTYLLKWKE